MQSVFTRSKNSRTMLKYVWEISKDSVKGFIDDEVLTMSAALAYYTAFSLAPLLLIAVSIAGAVFGQDAVSGALHTELSSTMGPEAAAILQKMVAGASRPSDSLLMSIIGTALLLIGAGGAFRQLQAALNKIWAVEAAKPRGMKGFAFDKLMTFAMVLTTGFLLLVSMLLTTVLQVVSERLGHISGLPLGTWLASSDLLSLVVVTLLFAAIFKVLPNARIEWRDVWVGALFTSLLFMVGKGAIGWYLGRQASASAYGSAGSFVVLLSWLYYSSIILLFGAEFTEAHTRRRDADSGNPPDRSLPESADGRESD